MGGYNSENLGGNMWALKVLMYFYVFTNYVWRGLFT